MSKLRERRPNSEAATSEPLGGNQTTVNDQGAQSQADRAMKAARSTGVSPAYKPGRALARMLRMVFRETIYIGVITVLALWATQSFFSRYSPDKVLFPPERLARVDGVSSRKVYLAVLGTMFDVSKGWGHYGPNGTYHGFAGRDASRAFITGKFEDDLTDDISGLTPKDLAALVDWRKFYMEHKVYKHIGRVIGRFYTAKGDHTAELERVEAAAAGAAGSTPDGSPESPCNVQWSATSGAQHVLRPGSAICAPYGKEVWCSPGKGFPRRMAGAPGEDGTVVERCECLKQPAYSEAARLYDGCAPSAVRCTVAAAAGASALS